MQYKLQNGDVRQKHFTFRAGHLGSLLFVFCGDLHEKLVMPKRHPKRNSQFMRAIGDFHYANYTPHSNADMYESTV
jgi:hypothetical protein